MRIIFFKARMDLEVASGGEFFFKARMDLEVASGCEIIFFKARMDLEVASGCEIFFQSTNGFESCFHVQSILRLQVM
jgi:hypothetical protein